MYQITDLSFESAAPDGEPRADDVFYPEATVCYEGDDEAPKAEVVMALDGKAVATEEIRLDHDECVTITPPGAPEPGPETGAPRWLAVFGDGAVVTTREGTVELSVTVADQYRSDELELQPSRGRVDTGTPIED